LAENPVLDVNIGDFFEVVTKANYIGSPNG